MIFFMAGTSDARELALALQHRGYPLIASVVTETAANVLAAHNLTARHGRLTTADMVQVLRDIHATVLVDASHPFAEEAHRTAMAAAAECNLPYIRYERAAHDFNHQVGITWVETYEEAALLAAQKKGSIMLTTGGKTLQIFTKHLLGDADIRLVARMLPRQDNMEKCDALGIEQKNIIAMQGPFSRVLNAALYAHYQTTLMITKESGGAGAVDEKVEAALEMGIEVIVIGRPKLEFGTSFTSMEDVIAAVESLLRPV